MRIEHAFQLLGILTGLALILGAMLWDVSCQRPHSPDDDEPGDWDDNLPIGLKR